MDVEVRVKSGSKKGPLVQPGALGELVVYVRQPAVDGKANAAAIELLATYYKIAPSRITIVRGRSSRIKLIRVAKDA